MDKLHVLLFLQDAAIIVFWLAWRRELHLRRRYQKATWRCIEGFEGTIRDFWDSPLGVRLVEILGAAVGDAGEGGR